MKKYIIFIITIIFTLSLLGRKSFNLDNTQNNDKGEIKEEKIDENSDNKVIDPIKEKIETMSINEKIGQLIVSGVDGLAIDDEITKLIKEDKIGGVILFSRNINNVNQVIDLTNSIKSINKENNIPLFISVDEEGGSVSRIPLEFSKLPSNNKIGKANNEELSYDIGSIIAEELSSLGFNMDFAPVLDIHSNPNNTVIGNRSFGNNAELVSKLGIKTMNGIKDGNIIPVVKHFPGHGDTDVDSHIGLPVVNHNVERLNEFEFVPFKNAIDNGAEAVMVSHILVKQLDAENPATLSKEIVTGVLREQLGFSGLVVTDDMTMGAISNYDLGEASIKSIEAGVDLLLLCHSYDNTEKVILSLKQAVDEGRITEERLDESVYRVLKLKEKYCNDKEIDKSINIDEINNKIFRIKERIKELTK